MRIATPVLLVLSMLQVSLFSYFRYTQHAFAFVQYVVLYSSVRKLRHAGTVLLGYLLGCKQSSPIHTALRIPLSIRHMGVCNHPNWGDASLQIETSMSVKQPACRVPQLSYEIESV
jgi:hypothetical protein